MIQVNAMGDTCPIPVVKTLKVLKTMSAPDVIEIAVDNEIAVQNLTRMAIQKGCHVKSEKLDSKKFKVIIEVTEAALSQPVDTENVLCILPSDIKKKIVISISSKSMGCGDSELGEVLMKGFIYALTQQEELPATLLFYNGGASITCEGSASLDDLKSLEAQGVEILTCGTCLSHYGLTEKLATGQVTNMYSIAEKLMQADLIIKP